jgi:hypothetical protein
MPPGKIFVSPSCSGSQRPAALESTMSRPRQRVCLEEGMRLNINQLLSSGAMPRPANGETAGTLSVRYPEIEFEQEIRFTSRPRHFGGRQYYFMCPATGRRCSTLWKPPGATRFASRQAWGGRVAYRSQFAEPSARAHLAKAKISARLRGPDWWDDVPPRPKRMRAATYARWEGRWAREEEKLDALLLRLFQTKWARIV